MAARGKRIAMLIEQDFEDIEVTEPLKIFKDAGIRVTVVGNGSQIIYVGKQRKAKFKPDITADKIDVQDFDALFIPGGYAPDKMRLHQPMVDVVKKFHNAGKLITALCHGPQLLVSADIVRGHRMTSWPSVAVDLKNAGAEWVDEPVVVDKDFITSRMPEDIPQFTRAVISALERVPAPVQAAG
jgi:protease I